MVIITQIGRYPKIETLTPPDRGLGIPAKLWLILPGISNTKERKDNLFILNHFEVGVQVS